MNKPPKRLNLTFDAFVIFIFAIAFFLRFYNLGGPSLWVDEPYHLYVAKSLQEDNSFNLPSGDTYDRAKLFAYFTEASTKIFGLNEFGVRFPSALFGLLSLLIIYVFIKKLLGSSVAIVAIFLLSFIPLEVGWARVSRFYTLFQFFTILVWFTFYVGFIKGHSNSKANGFLNNNTLKNIIRTWDINWIYLILFVIFLLIAISIQIIGTFLLLSILAFLLLYCIYLFLKIDLGRFLLSKYFIFSFTMVVTSIVGYVLFPQLRELVKMGLTYIPPFAKSSAAQDRFLYLKFIMGKGIFPLGALFIIGIFQAVFRLNKLIIYSALLFVIQVFLFTFVFSYRLFQYLYNVFPFFVIVASYAIVNIVVMEKEIFEKSKNFIFKFLSKYMPNPSKMLYISLIFILPFTQFFVDGIRTPFVKPGKSNGAVTFLEWREAANYVKIHSNGTEEIITTLPLTLKYYLGKADYDMNLSDYNLSKENLLKNKNGKYYDYYSGKPFITNVSQLDSLIKSTNSGFIIVDTYRLNMPQYVSPEIRKYIDQHVKKLYVSPYGTIRVFGWK